MSGLPRLFQHVPGTALAVGLALVLPAPLARSQSLSDLLGQGSSAKSGAPADAGPGLRLGRDRVDLSLTPSFAPLSGTSQKTLELGAQADLRMICGQFDVKAGLQSLLGREARQEFLTGILETLVHDIVGSKMELLCQAEPTLCTLLQSYSVSAHLKMGYYKDLCQAIESAVADASKKTYAATVDQCMKEKRDQGLSVDQAVEACKNKPPQLTGLRGQTLAELDLGKELGGLLETLGLSPGAARIAQRMGDGTQVTATHAASQPSAGALTGLFDELREAYASRLGALVAQASQARPLSSADLLAAAPPGAPALAADEIRAIALLRPDEQAAALGSLSSAMALYELGSQIHEVERAIEAVQDAPTVDAANRRRLEDRLARLRAEKIRLAEHLKDQSILLETYGSVRALADREYARRISDYQARAGEAQRTQELTDETRAWGSLPTAASPRRGAPAGQASPDAVPAGSCLGCGLESTVGSIGDGH